MCFGKHIWFSVLTRIFCEIFYIRFCVTLVIHEYVMHSYINRRIVFKTTIEFVNKGIYVLPVFKLWSHYSTMRFKSHLTGVLYSDSLLQYLTKVHYLKLIRSWFWNCILTLITSSWERLIEFSSFLITLDKLFDKLIKCISLFDELGNLIHRSILLRLTKTQ